MSIKLMSAIFETEIHDLPYTKDGESRKAKASTVKLVLLSLADHANDYGDSCFPGYDKMEIKTCLSRQGLADTYTALQQNGILLVDYKASRMGTNDYKINIRSFPKMADLWDDLPLDVGFPESSHLTQTVKPLDSEQSSHLTQTVKPLDHNHQVTIIQPSEEPPLGASPAPSEILLPLDWQIAKGGDIQVPSEAEQLRAEFDIACMNLCRGAVHLEGLASAFLTTRAILPRKSDYKGWKKALQSMYDAKPKRVQPEHLIQAIMELEEWKPGSVVDPFSPMNKAISIANPSGIQPAPQKKTNVSQEEFRQGLAEWVQERSQQEVTNV